MEQHQQNSKLNHIQGLDGLRALAALLVVFFHWPNKLLTINFGWIGVNIFFVLSGFLIARILLNTKQDGFRKYISQFYYKRALRIFPLYYGFLFASFLFILIVSHFIPKLLYYEDWRSAYYATTKNFPYYLTYTYNLRMNFRIFEPRGYLNLNRFFSHLWSLSLEEQFYIVFPFLIYFASVKNLKRVTIAILIICPLLRLWGALYQQHISDPYWFGELFYTNTISQSDALFTGVALAIFDLKKLKPYLTFITMVVVFLVVGITCLYCLLHAGYNRIPIKSLGFDFPGFWFYKEQPNFLVGIRPFYQYTIVNLLAASLILPAINGKPLFPALFKNEKVTYLGKISYGIYVFHLPVLTLLTIVAETMGGWLHRTDPPYLQIPCFVIYISLVIFLAHLSYQYFEKRFLKYK